MTDTPTITGKARVVQDMYDFGFYIEQLWSNGEWKRNHAWPKFKDVNDAQQCFERAKKVRKFTPADLGSLDDA